MHAQAGCLSAKARSLDRGVSAPPPARPARRAGVAQLSMTVPSPSVASCTRITRRPPPSARLPTSSRSRPCSSRVSTLSRNGSRACPTRPGWPSRPDPGPGPHPRRNSSPQRGGPATPGNLVGGDLHASASRGVPREVGRELQRDLIGHVSAIRRCAASARSAAKYCWSMMFTPSSDRAVPFVTSVLAGPAVSGPGRRADLPDPRRRRVLLDADRVGGDAEAYRRDS